MGLTAQGAGANDRPATVGVASPHGVHAALYAEALRHVDGPDALARRASLLFDIYRDSRGNHASPLIALHMMLWRQAFFAVDGHLGTVLQYRFCYDEGERARRLTMIQTFANTLSKIDSRICARIFANYHATKPLDVDQSTRAALPDILRHALVAVHESTRSRERFTPQRMKEVFIESWRYEQEAVIEAPLGSAIAMLDCPVLHALVVQPAMHLSYFTAHTRITYRDFSDTAERITRAVQAYDAATACGWAAVRATLHVYGVLPPFVLRSLETP